MNSQEKNSPLFWWPNIMVMAMMAVGILTKPQSLTSVRPSGTQGAKPDAVQPEHRLWEDPLPTQPNKKSEANATPAPKGETPPAPPELTEQLKTWLSGDLSESDSRVCILMVHLPTGGYAEEEERRMRFRYAMQAATGYAGYKADDLTPMAIVPVKHAGANRTVAKEVFRPFSPERKNWLAKKYDVVMVVYLGDFLFELKAGQPPLAAWRQVLQAMDQRCEYVCTQTDRTKLEVDFHIMGPSNSDRLVDLCTDLCVAEAEAEAEGKTTKLVQHGQVCFHACLPTLASEILIKLVTDAAPNKPGGRDSFQYHCRRMLGDKRVIEATRVGASLVRVAGDDYDLCKLLYDELASRGVHLQATSVPETKEDATGTKEKTPEPALKAKKHDDCLLALISEWDTTYGRALPLTFNAVIREYGAHPQQTEEEKKKNWSWHWEDQNMESRTLCRFSYLRGLDGQLPNDAAKSGRSDKEGGEGATDRPQGRSQADYVHRIVERMQAIEQSELRSFRAIGILGSDVYDKLMILRALRPAFPGAVFFTTDLDASMDDASQYDWTQNLIVASRFGLRAHEAYQGWSPPFREGYQTGFYLGCLEALGSTYYDSNARLQHLTPVDWSAPSLLFEIGRSGPWQLTPPPGAVARLHAAGHPLLSLWPGKQESKWEPEHRVRSGDGQNIAPHDMPHANPQPQPMATVTEMTFPLTLTLVILVAGVCLSSSMGREQEVVTEEASSVALKMCTLLLGWVWVVGMCGWWLSNREEPFLFWNGISVWPSALMLSTVPCLCVHYLWTSWLNLRLNREALAKECAAAAEPWVDDAPETPMEKARSEGMARRLIKHLFPAYSDGERLEEHWQKHIKNCGFQRCMRRTIAYVVVCTLLSWIATLSLPHVHTNLVRGGLSRMLTTEWVPMMALFFFLMLLFYAVDACLVCAALLRTAIKSLNGRADKAAAAAERTHADAGTKAANDAAPKVAVTKTRAAEMTRAEARAQADAKAEAEAKMARQVRQMIKRCASRGDIVASFIYYPFIVLFILIASRHRVLDGFDWSLEPLLIYSSSLLILVIITTVLQGTANRLKKVAVRVVETSRERSRGDTSSHDETLKYLEGMDSPVFSTVYSNPVFRAVLIPLGGTGALHGLDLLSTLMK
ncbi:hypothetical protein [Prosthecobacter fluviatilis]|uniref:Uncharacterized protein n=1 Tax=Prosthecobacter fluviatilis TaxID=445931 RepID=A0ABW0KUP1_9BACT